jgi:hypothetical protein
MPPTSSRSLAHGRQDHREGASRRAAADHGWPDRAELRARPRPHGVLAQFGVELIGANREAIDMAEDRQLFDQAMRSIGLATPRSAIAQHGGGFEQVQGQIGYPCIIRPSFTMGGSGGGIAYNREEFVEICQRGLALSPTKRAADRRVADRLEGVRDGGGARSGRQLHHRLHHRKLRPDGGAHRRLDHGGTGTDPDRQGISDAA